MTCVTPSTPKSVWKSPKQIRLQKCLRVWLQASKEAEDFRFKKYGQSWLISSSHLDWVSSSLYGFKHWKMEYVLQITRKMPSYFVAKITARLFLNNLVQYVRSRFKSKFKLEWIWILNCIFEMFHLVEICFVCPSWSEIETRWALEKGRPFCWSFSVSSVFLHRIPRQCLIEKHAGKKKEIKGNNKTEEISTKLSL